MGGQTITVSGIAAPFPRALSESHSTPAARGAQGTGLREHAGARPRVADTGLQGPFSLDAQVESRYGRSAAPSSQPETGDTIAAAISLGLSFKEAAQLAGVDETTLHRWRNRGRDSARQPYRQFCQRIDAAQASTARDYLQAVRRSVIEPTVTTKTTTRPGPDGQPVTETVETVSPPDIKGALWWLERRLPALFGRRLEHAGSIDSTHDREKPAAPGARDHRSDDARSRRQA